MTAGAVVVAGQAARLTGMTHVSLTYPVGTEWLGLSQAQAAADLPGWAKASIKQLAQHRGGKANMRKAGPLVQHLIDIGGENLVDGGIGCLLHVPGAALPVQGVLRVALFAGPETAEEFAEQQALLETTPDDAVQPNEVEVVRTVAGPATRIRTVLPDPAAPEAQLDSTTWVWWFGDEPATVLATMTLPAGDTAAQSRAAADLLVAGTERTDGPPATLAG